jgi:uncharacterized protein (DUF58 family)
VRPTRLTATLVGFTAALALVARTTGAGWTVVVVCCVVATIAVGAVWPAIAVRRVSLAVQAPPDATAGRPVELTVEVSGTRSPVRVRVVEPTGEPVAVDPPATGPVAVVAARRGIVDRVVAEITCAAPLGLVWWRVRRTVELARPLEVAPAPVEEPLATTALATKVGGEAVRSLREYRAGDPSRLVHWPATARRGQLIVKELEEPDRPGLVIQVDLNGDPETAEHTAGRAMGAACGALRAGLEVTLLTAEAGGPRAGRVRTALEAGRRLARATAGAPAEGPVPEGAAVVRL